MGTLTYIDPTLPRSRLTPVMARLGTNRLAKFVSRHLAWRLDPLLLRVSRGRLSTTLVIPSAVLETRGARTGHRRRNAIIYFHDGASRVVIAASNAGGPRHPDWYHNLRANPEVVFGDQPMRATIIRDEAEQRRLWALADRVFPAFSVFRRNAADAGRTIPLIALDPQEHHTTG